MRTSRKRWTGGMARRLAPMALFLAGWGVVSANLPPVVQDVTITPEPELGVTPYVVQCYATDPEGGSLTFDWTTSAGTLTGAAAHAPTVTWAPPQVMGNPMLKFTVRDNTGNTFAAERLAPLGPIRSYARVSAPLRQPGRMTVAPDTSIWVTDSSPARLVHLDSLGNYLGQFATGPHPTAVAVGLDGNLVVCEDGLDRVMRYTPSGTPIGALGDASLVLRMPNSVKVDPVTGQIFVVDTEQRLVFVFSQAGALERTFGGTHFLNVPVDIAINHASAEYYVADQDDCVIKVFDSAGTLFRRYGSAGYGNGQFTRLQAIDLDANSRIVALDSVHCRIQLFNPDGTVAAIAGHMGTWSGAMQDPSGMAVFPGQRIVIASASTSDLRIFAYWDWVRSTSSWPGTGYIIK